MSIAAFQRVTARIKQALVDQAVADQINRGRLAPVPQEVASAVVVRFDRASGQAMLNTGITDWDTAVALDCYQRVTDGSDPEDACSEVLNAAFEAVRLMDLSGLGIENISDTPEIVAGPSDDQDLFLLTLYLSVRLRTAPNTLNPQD